MATPRDFIMNFNFKIVYTEIVYNIEISSNNTIKDLFEKASSKFKPHINYDSYKIDFVIAGQKNSEMAEAINESSLDNTLYYQFGEKWRQISFYIRPIDKITDSFIRMDAYNMEREFNHVVAEEL